MLLELSAALALLVAAPITDSTGTVIGKIDVQGDRQVVTDRCGTRLGYADPSGTYDNTGTRIAGPGAAAILLAPPYIDRGCGLPPSSRLFKSP